MFFSLSLSECKGLWKQAIASCIHLHFNTNLFGERVILIDMLQNPLSYISLRKNTIRPWSWRNYQDFSHLETFCEDAVQKGS